MIRYAISDIHGNANAFLKLLDHVDPDPEELVILGDLGDRGLQTWEVYEECAQLADEGAKFVMGNHDLWFQQYLQGKIHRNTFCSPDIGGLTTLKSIEMAQQRHNSSYVMGTLKKVWGHMEAFVETDDYIFVHAGINPKIHEMHEQNIEVLTMGCPDWKNPHIQHSFTQTIVFGHTPTPLVHKEISEEDARIWSSKRSRKMAIDTGAGFYMRLTLIDLMEGTAYAYDFHKRDIIEYRFKRKERGY